MFIYSGLQFEEAKSNKTIACRLFLQAKCKAVPFTVSILTSRDGHFSNNFTTIEKR